MKSTKLLSRFAKIPRKVVAMVASGLLVLLIGGVILTKANYLPNFLGLKFLYIPTNKHRDEDIAYKPIIYLYPENNQQIRVQLDYQGEIFADYPDYDPGIGGREVMASPDGSLINLADNREYSYLFWEGIPREKIDWDLSKGFVVKGSETKIFLQEKLSRMGLTPKEYNEFIVYWFPQMQDNEYNLIHFAGDQYTATAPLIITPEPDSILRVFMVWKAVDMPIDLEEQIIEPFQRTGFSVIERGGSEVL